MKIAHYKGGRQQKSDVAQDHKTILGPHPIDRAAIKRPFVTRAPVSVELGEAVPAKLPQGVLLTGGKKLRDAGLTGKGIRVAVIDSGVDAEHPAFQGRVTKKEWYRYGTPLSEDDHGTHVAGSIHLMAPDAEIFDYRVFGQDGSLMVNDAVVAAIKAACSDGCQLINMSLGSPVSDPEIRAAIQHAQSQGVHIICAAGNMGDGNPLTNENSWPANYDETISIAALSKEDRFAASFSNSNPKVDYGGIGVKVVSLKPGGGFQEMSGTSMAAPHVTGLIAALLTGASPCPSNEDLRKMLTEKYAIDVGVKGPDASTGLGFLSYLDKEEVDKLAEGFPRSETTPPQSGLWGCGCCM